MASARSAFHDRDTATAPRRSVFAAMAFAGLISGCQSQQAVMPPVIGVRNYLEQRPMSMAEEMNERSAFPLNGKIASCRGQANCTVEVYPGDILMNVKFGDENENNMEVTVSSMGGSSITLQRRIDFRSGESSYDYQTLNVGESATLFNTDITLNASKGEQGRFFIQLN